MPAFPDLDGPLSAGRAQLRLAAERDIPEVLIAHQDDPSMESRLGLDRAPSGAELGRRVESAAAERAAGVGLWLTVLRPGSDECRGQLDVVEVDWDHQRAQTRIWIGQQDRNQGLARSALSLAGAWLVQACGLIRVELLIASDNEPMLRAGRAAGFSPEGTLRAYLRERRRRVDVAMMSLIATDLQTP